MLIEPRRLVNPASRPRRSLASAGATSRPFSGSRKALRLHRPVSRNAINELVDHVPFVDEAPLTSKVVGSAAFRRVAEGR